MTEVLGVISDLMSQLGLNYEFGRCSQSPPQYPYWVGDYTESENATEDGKREATVMLTGFARNTLQQMEREKAALAAYFLHGVTMLTDSNTAIAIFYAGAQNLPTEDAELRKTQVNLTVKFWKGK